MSRTTPDAHGRSADVRPKKPAAPTVHRFSRLARAAGQATGRPSAFLFAMGFVLLWAIAGPFFGWSDTWQLVINTSTTILTFLMIFLLQNSQNRDAEAVQLKLDELIRAVDKARNSLVAAEELEDDERAELQEKFKEIAERGRREENGLPPEEPGRPDPLPPPPGRAASSQRRPR